jgi:uncharacterized PurR-regulated membrane protein YhhQ (DUF165 family)
MSKSDVILSIIFTVGILAAIGDMAWQWRTTGEIDQKAAFRWVWRTVLASIAFLLVSAFYNLWVARSSRQDCSPAHSTTWAACAQDHLLQSK